MVIYRLRIQIEQQFRYLKSSFFALSFEHHKGRCVQRIIVVILIATVNSIRTNIIGLAMFMA